MQSKIAGITFTCVINKKSPKTFISKVHFPGGRFSNYRWKKLNFLFQRYCPVFTDRKVPLTRNALDSTKRLAQNAWEKASLQEAMLIHKQEFISKSRARVRHVKLRKEQRIIEKVNKFFLFKFGCQKENLLTMLNKQIFEGVTR